ncbi:putative Mg(2+) transport ATPase [Aquisphaera giovannonii]|uniref:Putative Mg(2+) transport ATPase n=1 Tax=Aquisphaera giovannonii TaxID=406548 RepID=A0A5B9W9G1_9BACT|nr:MgtC/SapB family protein [Aquisphaera giovannonii]QEH37077.1 putative Mg(2+) transport ATPase [Aquisphaera giovannonii]
MPISAQELVLRLAISILLGGAIGLERELREQAAGLRTHLLVALSSATIMILSTQFVFYQHYEAGSLVHVDVSRIASNVVVGIGFLGGGAILHDGIRTKGLTTAASLWLVATIGMCCGAGMFTLGLLTSGGSIFALVVLRKVEERIKKEIYLRLQVEADGGGIAGRARIEQALTVLGARVVDTEYVLDRSSSRSSFTIMVRLPRRDLEDAAVTALQDIPETRRVTVTRVTDLGVRS